MLTLLLCAASLQSPPNFLVVLLDDVGRDKVTAYGDHPGAPPTPHLDGLADRGVLFRNAWAYPLCSPTRAALLTGRYAERTGIGEIIRPGDGVYTSLPLSETILPEALPGYRSTAIGKWHLRDAGDPDTHVLDSGFDAYYGSAGGTQYFDWVENINGTLTPRSGYHPVVLGGQAIRTVQGIREPYFVYYCPRLAHSPFHAPPPALHSQPTQPTEPVGQHLAMTEAIDAVLGRILEHVDLSDTYVFVIGDNGSPVATVTPPFEPSHVKSSVYEGGLRVPFIVAGPDVPAGLECDELVHVVDMFATITELAGLGAPAAGAEDSVSFAPILRNPGGDGARSFLYAHRFPFPGTVGNDILAIRTRRWKLIESAVTGAQELYDLDADPFEIDNLLQSDPGPATDAIRDRMISLKPIFP